MLHEGWWEELPGLKTVSADSAYRAHCLREEVFDYAPFRLVVVSRPAGAKGFVRLPQRWVVERTFAWLGRARRLAKDVEASVESSVAMIQICMIHLMLRRLAPSTELQTYPFQYAG